MYEKILVPVDGSELAECVLPHVETIAKGVGVSQVIFLRVVEPLPPAIAGGDYFFTDIEREKLEDHHEMAAKRYLEQLVNRFQYDRVTFTGEVVVGKPAENIADYATQHQVDLIVMATHGRSGVSRWIMGSVAERILRWSCVPVLVVRPPQCAIEL